MKKIFIIFILIFNNTITLGSLKIALFNDLNGSLGNPDYNRNVRDGIEFIIEKKPDLAISAGDIISGEDFRRRLGDTLFKKMWKSFSENIHQPLKRNNIPFAPSPGNHDANASLSKEVWYYKNYFLVEENKPKVNFIDKRKYPFYYSYIYKGVFFISMDDTKTHRLIKNPIDDVTQKEWIKNQLESKVAQDAKARIVYGHIPLYSVLNKRKHKGKYKEVLHHEQLNSGKKNPLEEILLNNNVSLVIFAHSHAYYPGVIKYKSQKKLHFLFSPCLGPGHRYLNGNYSARSQEGHTLITISDKGKIHYQVYDEDNRPTPTLKLPKKIISNSNTIIYRDDELTIR